MIKHVTLGPDDVVEMAGQSQILPPGAIEVTTPLPINALFQFMFVGGLLVQRPASAIPLVAGNVVTISNCPSGTEIEVMDLSGKERMALIICPTDDFDQTVTLPDAGLYEINVTAPSPHVPTRTRVEVT